MRTLSLRAAVALACAWAVLFPAQVSADPARNIQAAARVLTFLENGPTGRTVIGIVYNPDNAASVAEKNAMMAGLSGGYAAGSVTLVGRPVAADAIGGVRYVFVTHGVDYAAVGAEARARRIIAIGSDPACVVRGACAIGITTDPTVQIVVNHTAAAAVGAALRSAFRMMIHEI